MTEIEDVYVLKAMRKYGGGFVSSLAIAGLCADDDNMRRIKSAWPEYWKKYTRMAQSDLEKEKSTKV